MIAESMLSKRQAMEYVRLVMTFCIIVSAVIVEVTTKLFFFQQICCFCKIIEFSIRICPTGEHIVKLIIRNIGALCLIFFKKVNFAKNSRRGVIHPDVFGIKTVKQLCVAVYSLYFLQAWNSC